MKGNGKTWRKNPDDELSKQISHPQRIVLIQTDGRTVLAVRQRIL